MSKELTPLEALEKLTNYKCSRMSEKIECKEIIKNALVKLEKAKSCVFTSRYDVKKEHKALEIIKEKKVDVGALYELNLEFYNKYAKEINGTPTLTSKEYKLLREIL